MRFILSLLLILQPILSTAQTTNKAAEFNIADGVSYSKNFVINPSARKNVNNLGIAAGTATRETGAGYQFDGISSIKYDSGVINGTLTFNLSTITSPALSGNCEFYFYYKGDGTTWRAYIGNGSSEISSVVLQNATDWRFVNIFAPCGATPEVGITETTTTNKTLYFAGAYYGQAVHLGSGVPPNTFVANFSSAGAVSQINVPGWVSACTVSPTGTFTCPVQSGLVTSQMACSLGLTGASSGDQTPSRVVHDVGTNSLVFNTMTGAGTGTNISASVTCTKTGSDYIQPAITPNNFNFSPRMYSAGTANAPSVTGASYTYSRSGSQMTVTGSFTATAAGGAGTFSVDIPSGFTTTDTNKTGNFYWLDAGTAHNTGTVRFSDNNTMTFFVAGAAANLAGSAFANTDTFSFNITFPAAEGGVAWTENQGAPQLVNSVITQYNGVNSKIESELNCDASSSITSQSGGISTIGNRSGNTCALTLTSGVFTATPWKCQVTVKSTTVQATGCTCSSATSCTIAGPSADFDAYVSIEGPK